MKFAVVRKYDQSISKYKKSVLDSGFKYSVKKPDMVLCIGGDGTFFHAERLYPGVPKVLYRESKICKKCVDLSVDQILEIIKDGNYKIDKLMKLQAKVKKQDFLAVNDIVMRNRDQTRALRFSFDINGKCLCHEIIGDGVVIATPFGSTAYFNSITRQKFDKGIGLAFNNSVEEMGPMFLKHDDTVKLKVLRGKAILSADNNRKMIELKQGSEVVIKKDKSLAKLVRLI